MNRRVTLLSLLAAGVVAACSPPGCERGDACASIESLRTYRPPEATRLFAADGSFLADLSPQRRVVLELEEIPETLRRAFVAVEDRRFWSHRGVDGRALIRAAWRDLRARSFREGSSTITMQLARNLFPEALPRTKTLRRKAWEILLAGRIEREFSKEQILELYLNQIYLGSGLYGVEAAAQGHFGKSVRQLDTAEIAMLVAMARGPELYHPRRRPLRAIQRRNAILHVMAREGVITPEEARHAMAEAIRLAPPLEAAGAAPYYVAAVRRELRERYGPDADVLGLRVYTALEPDLQGAAQRALADQIQRIEDGAYGRYPHAVPGANGSGSGESEASPFLQGMLVALDPRTGDVLALVGGRDFAHSQFDRAFQARRQAGSAFKPIVYAAALEHGLTLADRVGTGPVLVDDGHSPPWRPADHVADSIHSLSVRDAVALSSNHAAVRIGRWVGEARVAALARELGLTTTIPEYPSLHLGAADVVPAELTAAYAAFANGGFRVRPRLITRIEHADGRVLWRAPPSRTRVLDPGVAFLTLQSMTSVIENGTGTAARRAGLGAAAGKTGTTNDARDAWFVGMTPGIVAGVWLGFDQPRPILPRASGGRLAAPVWGAFMEQAYRSRPAPPPWPQPENVVARDIDAATGALATGNCPEEHRRTEFFLAGTEPVHTCSLHPESGAERFFRRLWRGLRSVL